MLYFMHAHQKRSVVIYLILESSACCVDKFEQRKTQRRLEKSQNMHSLINRNSHNMFFWWFLNILVCISIVCCSPQRCAEIMHQYVGDEYGNQTVYSSHTIPYEAILKPLLGPQIKPAIFYFAYRINYNACEPEAIVVIHVGGTLAKSVAVSDCVSLGTCEEILQISIVDNGLVFLTLSLDGAVEPIDTAEITVMRKFVFTPTVEFNIGSQDNHLTVELGRGTYMPLTYPLFGMTQSNLNWKLKVGKFTSIATGLHIICPSKGGHVYRSPTIYPFGSFIGDYEYIQQREPFEDERYRIVTIGNDVWIGLNVTIMYNVTIGDGAVVGAHTVLREDVPPYAVVVGNPQRIVKFRFHPQVVASMMRIKWWDWPDDEIFSSEFYKASTEEFVSKYDSTYEKEREYKTEELQQ